MDVPRFPQDVTVCIDRNFITGRIIIVWFAILKNIVRDGKKIAPIEVKSSSYTNHSSLDYLMDTYSKTLGQAYVLYLKDPKKDGNILFLPPYMAICL